MSNSSKKELLELYINEDPTPQRASGITNIGENDVSYLDQRALSLSFPTLAPHFDANVSKRTTFSVTLTSNGTDKPTNHQSPGDLPPIDYKNSMHIPSDLKFVDKYVIGNSPVDLRGQLILDTSKTGGWRAAIFIFGNETAERMAYFGILINTVFYLYYKFHIQFPTGSVMITNVIGTAALTPLLGAFLADAYLGRFWTIGIFSMIYLLGLTLLTISAALPNMRPSDVGCNDLKRYLGMCDIATKSQMSFLYLALYTIALGTGGIRPCISSFGADQFNTEDPKEKRQLGHFFNAFYFMITIGSFLSLTLVVWISDKSWGLAYGILTLSMGLSNIIFYLGIPFYRHKLPSGSPLTRVIQVIVAAIRKRRVELPCDAKFLYEVYDKESAIVGSRKLSHTKFFGFLDKAAVEIANDKVCNSDNRIAVNHWKLCTVTQVEELKVMVRMIPIWASCIFINTVLTQMANFAGQQATTMTRKLGHITVPAAFIGVASVLGILMFLPLYDRVLVPWIRRFTGLAHGITFLQRIGVGLLISIFAVVVAALVERKRRQLAWDNNDENNPTGIVPMSAWWLSIQFGLIGVAEVFASIGQLEFFYDQAPDGMRSLGSAFNAATLALGSYLGSFMVSVIKKYIGKHNPKNAWISNMINQSHLEYYFWLLAGISVLNFIGFVINAHMYKYKVEEHSTMRPNVINTFKKNIANGEFTTDSTQMVSSKKNII